MGSSTREFSYNASDQLTGIDNNWTTHTFDANGSRSATNHGYNATYNSRGQVISMTPDGGGSAIAMSYMGTDQQVRVAKGSTTFHYRVIGGMSDQKTGGTTTSYIIDPSGNVIGQKTGSQKQYFLNDKLGSTVALTNQSGAVVQRFSYEPFGKLTTTNIAVDASIKYAGGFHDKETNFYKFGNRYYDADNAVWTQRDVLAGHLTDPKTMNRYAYVGGSPTDFVDPTGFRTLGQSLERAFAWAGKGATIGSLGGCAVGALAAGVGCVVVAEPAGLAGGAIGLAAAAVTELFDSEKAY